MVKNLPSNAGDVSSISGWGTEIPHAAGQLGLCIATTEPTWSPCNTSREKFQCNERSSILQRRSDVSQLRPDPAEYINKPILKCSNWSQ